VTGVSNRPGRSAPPRPADRGSAGVWVISCCVLLMLMATVATVRGLAVLARHRAEAGADLAALAAAGRIGLGGDGCAEARQVARDNGSRLSACRLRLDPGGRSGSVEVEVVLIVHLPIVGTRLVPARARAARLPGPDSPAAPGPAPLTS
jgi:secretion/DNA translocation related TadE-like protein